MENPLAAIPEVAPGVEARADDRGWLQLRKPRLYTGGIAKWLGHRLRWRADIQVQLDEYGTFYWRQVDGRHSLDQIAAAFSERYARSREESRRAVMQFTRDLMLRHIIQLQQP